MNILLALDDESSANICKSLNGSDFHILACVNDGISATQAIVNLQPDVIVLDLILPSLDGFGVLEFISKKVVNKKPNIIVASALTSDGFVSKAFELGADDFIAKPFAVESLKSHLENFNSKDNILRMPKGPKSKIKLVEETITNIFLSIGIPAHIKGYQYLREAILLTYENPNLINNITKELYPSVAQIFETTASKVERAIRHAIEIAWNKGKIENINMLFGYKVYTQNDRPTNSEFIALIADKMILEQGH